ncbi:MAG: hypothetical protein NT062_04635 [Proteobacteria bacterium]|nr:hypothetical protein [Pseudomonadota bacterium]
MPSGRPPLDASAISIEDVPPSDEDEDDEFPPVEETMDVMPAAFRVAERQHSPHIAVTDFVSHTPPPFNNDTSTNEASLEPLPPAAPSPGKRGALMPALVVMMVVITGGALFLVWRMMEKSGANPPGISISNGQIDDAGVITINTDPRPPDVAPRGSAGSAGGAAGSGSATTTRPTDAVRKPTSTPSGSASPVVDAASFQRALTATVEKQKPAIVQCIAKHGMPPVGTAMVLAISTAGRATSVTFNPAEPGQGFAACIRGVMSAVSYPHPPVAWVQNVTLRAR